MTQPSTANDQPPARVDTSVEGTEGPGGGTRPHYYGWVVIATAMACSALSSPGQSFILSLYLDHFSADLGLSTVELSSLYSLATLSAATALPLVGRLADRTSSRRFLAGVLLLLAVVFAYMATVRSALALGVTMFALRLLAQGAIGLGTITTAVRWFRRYRGRALALVSLGYSVGELLFPGLVLALVGALGWRGSWLALAAVYAFLMVPGVALLLRERDPRREPVDGTFAGDSPAASAPHAHSVSDAGPETPLAFDTPADEPSISLGAALRTPVFWGLLLCAAVSPLVMTGIIFHQVGLFASRGWSATMVPAAFICFAVAGVVSTYATGLLVERVPTRHALAGGLAVLLLALGSLWLPLPPLPAALSYGTVLGLAGGAINAANAALWPEYFGIAALGSIKGVVNAVRNGATAVGPPLVALLLTPAGSYTVSVGALAAITLAGALGALACRPIAAHGMRASRADHHSAT